jgi:nucleoside-triphosphatase
MGVAVLITGRPGVGKTTIIERIVARLPGRAGGFYTRELREGGKRVGFELVTLSGERGVLARVGRRGGPRVAQYGVDVGTVERLGVPALRRAAREADYVVVDEIGRMELLSAAFAATMRELVGGPYRLLGSIMQRPHPVADELKRMPGVHLIEMTVADRSSAALVERAVALLTGEAAQ